MSPELSRRLALAYDKALPDEQRWLNNAAAPQAVRTAEDMSPVARDLLAEIEARDAMPLPRGFQ